MSQGFPNSGQHPPVEGALVRGLALVRTLVVAAPMMALIAPLAPTIGTWPKGSTSHCATAAT